MNASALTCRDQRRVQSWTPAARNGIEYLEVRPDDRKRLEVYFFDGLPKELERAIRCHKEAALQHVRIDGGRRVRNIRVVDVNVATSDCGQRFVAIGLDNQGDQSTYTLRLLKLDQEGRQTDEPLAGLDPRYAQIDFTFDVASTSDIDCRRPAGCPPVRRADPPINYLARDYASFRQLIFDRLAVVMPDWRERHVPDLGVTLVELLAGVADYLSYEQDAVATEAYLGTARRRISVRRHARLVDYRMHEGCNARAFVHVKVSEEEAELRAEDIYFVTTVAGLKDKHLLAHRDLPSGGFEAFEPVEEAAGPPELRSSDLKDPAGLIGQLVRGAGRDILQAFSKHARRQLKGFWKAARGQTQKGIVPRASQSLEHCLLEELNEWIRNAIADNGANTDPQSCSAQTANSSAATRELRQCARPGEPSPRLNRAILEDRFPHYIGRSAHASRFIRLYSAHNHMCFHTWGDEQCCLPIGATAATLADACPAGQPAESAPAASGRPTPPPRRLGTLSPGDILIFEEVRGAKTGQKADADPTHRQAVRLTRVRFAHDPVMDQPVVEIEWAREDALRFPLCISAVTPAPKCAPLHDVSVALGNVVLVDHGRRIEGEDLGQVQARQETVACGDGCAEEGVTWLPQPFQPTLKELDLSFGEPLRASQPAAAMLTQEPAKSLPKLEVSRSRKGQDANEAEESRQWTPQLDLLSSGPEDQHFTVEMNDERRAELRFGDGRCGRQPGPGMAFLATYRIGNGPSGNVGGEAISHIVVRRGSRPSITGVRNPLAAMGGQPPETLEEVRQLAPHAFRKRQQRAVIADDYAGIVEREFSERVHRAKAVLAWTGSWHEVSVAVDPLAAVEDVPALLKEIEDRLYRYRRIGHDVRVVEAQFVPLRIGLTVCVGQGHLRAHVKAGLLEIFSNRILPDGRQGLFHPDRLTFGDGVYLSRLIEAAAAVPGVDNVTVTRLERLFGPPDTALADGVLKLAPLEIARLDNDPGHPTLGVLCLEMRGRR